MKSNRSFWTIIICAWFWLIALFLLTNCTTSKQVSKSREQENVEQKSSENLSTRSQATTQMDTRTRTDTRVTEEFDTLAKRPGSKISGIAPIGDLFSGIPMRSETEDMILETFYDSLTRTIHTQATAKEKDVRVRGKRTSERTEMTQQNQTKQETSQSVSEKKAQLSKQTDAEKISKQVSRSGIPAWLIVMAVLAVIVGVAVLLWRMKVF
jgi:cytoskeletal protein RodZ